MVDMSQRDGGGTAWHSSTTGLYVALSKSDPQSFQNGRKTCAQPASQLVGTPLLEHALSSSPQHSWLIRAVVAPIWASEHLPFDCRSRWPLPGTTAGRMTSVHVPWCRHGADAHTSPSSDRALGSSTTLHIIESSAATPLVGDDTAGISPSARSERHIQGTRRTESKNAVMHSYSSGTVPVLHIMDITPLSSATPSRRTNDPGQRTFARSTVSLVRQESQRCNAF